MVDRPVEDNVASGETWTALREQLSRLPLNRRVVIDETVINDRVDHEVAAKLGVTNSRVNQLRRDALYKLRIKLRKNLNDL